MLYSVSGSVINMDLFAKERELVAAASLKSGELLDGNQAHPM